MLAPLGLLAVDWLVLVLVVREVVAGEGGVELLVATGQVLGRVLLVVGELVLAGAGVVALVLVVAARVLGGQVGAGHAGGALAARGRVVCGRRHIVVDRGQGLAQGDWLAGGVRQVPVHHCGGLAGVRAGLCVLLQVEGGGGGDGLGAGWRTPAYVREVTWGGVLITSTHLLRT